MNPYKIKEDDLPLIVFSDHSSGAIQWVIKWWTKGHYNHVMWMNRPGYFASQGNLYSEALLKRYMKRGNRLKFIYVKNLNPVQRKMILMSIYNKLQLPWWKRVYDWPGVLFGQGTKLKGLSLPGLDYCSEDVPEHLRDNIMLINHITDKKLKDCLKNIPKHGSPEDLNQYMKNNEEFFGVYGRWDSDE